MWPKYTGLLFFVTITTLNVFLFASLNIWGHGSAQVAKSSQKAARPYHPFLEAAQAIFDPYFKDYLIPLRQLR